MAIIPAVAPGTGHFGRRAEIGKQNPYLAGKDTTDLPTPYIRNSKRMAEVGMSKTKANAEAVVSKYEAANQFLEAQAQANANSPQAVQARALAQQAINAKIKV